MKQLIKWMSGDEGWKSVMALVYAIICIFDFILVPMWIGFARVDMLEQLQMKELLELNPSVQIEIIDAMTYQHQPFTLQGGGLFHLSFGALLTGSAISKRNQSS